MRRVSFQKSPDAAISQGKTVATVQRNSSHPKLTKKLKAPRLDELRRFRQAFIGNLRLNLPEIGRTSSTFTSTTFLPSNNEKLLHVSRSTLLQLTREWLDLITNFLLHLTTVHLTKSKFSLQKSTKIILQT
jgi:hypothetical protein